MMAVRAVSKLNLAQRINKARATMFQDRSLPVSSGH